MEPQWIASHCPMQREYWMQIAALHSPITGTLLYKHFALANPFKKMSETLLMFSTMITQITQRTISIVLVVLVVLVPWVLPSLYSLLTVSYSLQGYMVSH